jgi:serine/threonine protein kinase
VTLFRAEIGDAPDAFLRAIGHVFAVFDRQDSGNVCYGVEVGGERWFVKTAGAPDDTRVFGHEERVELLRNAERLAAHCRHRALTRLRHTITSPTGPLLVYEWCEGELLGAEHRDDPRSAYQRFRQLPPATIYAALEAIYELHVELGWVACDFYDGCLLYDFARGELRAMDLDSYRDAPFTNTMGRMFGSTRFMAPEEFELGARIDHATTAFTLGRAGLVLLSEPCDPVAFRGTAAQRAVLAQATQPVSEQRFASAAELLTAWRAA